jgi:hypothetical protein
VSRGLGRTQRFVLDYLDTQSSWVLALDIVDAWAGGDKPTRAQRESVMRAIRTLAYEELVDTEINSSDVLRRIRRLSSDHLDRGTMRQYLIVRVS